MANHDFLVAVPGVCAGHPEHPEMLWIFEQLPSGVLRFVKLEIDFPEPEAFTQAELKKFDVEMRGFEGCPYCEAKLYFFCKKCKTLSCFSWEQVNHDGLWTCHSCKSVYRMRPKTTPFRVEAQVGTQPAQQGHHHHAPAFPNTPNTQHTGSFTNSLLATGHTQSWHPKK